MDKGIGKKAVKKIHLQLGHASKEELKQLDEDACGKKERKENMDGYEKEIERM